MNKAINTFSGLTTAHLEAIYNRSWREHHNGIDVNKHKYAMDTIKLVCGMRGIEITGRGGSWELLQKETK